MCLMCIEIAKSRMTFDEARKALPELVRSTENAEELQHYKELLEADDENLKKLAQEAAAKLNP